MLALESTGIPTQEADLVGTIIVDAYNGFNELFFLMMLWKVRHLCMEGSRFAFNCYNYWAQFLLHRLEHLPVTLLIREGVTQG